MSSQSRRFRTDSCHIFLQSNSLETDDTCSCSTDHNTQPPPRSHFTVTSTRRTSPFSLKQLQDSSISDLASSNNASRKGDNDAAPDQPVWFDSEENDSEEMIVDSSVASECFSAECDAERSPSPCSEADCWQHEFCDCAPAMFSSQWWEQQRKTVAEHKIHCLTRWVEESKFSAGHREGDSASLRLLHGLPFQDRCISVLSLITEAANRKWRQAEMIRRQKKLALLLMEPNSQSSEKEVMEEAQKDAKVPSKAQRKRAFAAPWHEMRKSLMASIRQEITECVGLSRRQHGELNKEEEQLTILASPRCFLTDLRRYVGSLRMFCEEDYIHRVMEHG